MNTNPRKTTGLRELGPVDIAALRAEVLAIPQSVWDEENARKPNRNYDSLDRTEHLVFRFIVDHHDATRHEDYPLWASWRSRLEPVLRQAVAPYGYARGAYPRIMLAKMAPGGVIKPHIDRNPAAGWPHKIHVPLLTNPGVRFYIDPEWHHLREGVAYEVNNRGVHAVCNDGDQARIHLIFEYYDLDQPLPARPDAG
jgi:hypothetical protein